MLDATKVAGQTPAEPGTTVTVEWGNEHYSPFPYHGVDTGTIRVTAPVHPGESVSAAAIRIYAELAQAGAQMRTQKLNDYLRAAVTLKAHVASAPAPAAGGPR